ncbi:MAG: class I poly(R)-hydroxyalkanoic acid synthase [Burkholderiales bacterium]|nr:class I poly(R)-hydroxyalkanoic acid synthase [Burkholderiales bacterium]
MPGHAATGQRPVSTEPPVEDREEAARVFAEVAHKSSRLLAEFMQRHADGNGFKFNDEFGLAQAFMELWAGFLLNPWKFAELQAKIAFDHAALWQRSWLRLWGQAVVPVAEPAKDDRRFRHEDWEAHFLFDYIKQSYLITARHLRQSVAGADHLPEETRRKVDFFTRQYVDALAPSNFALTNPQVLRETLRSGGQNLLKGMSNLLDDLERGRISMTDESAFEVGRNVAAMPGKVVFQNELMQLIQYAPLTETVYRRPLLIIPPWINKYYILDLREDNSFIRWASSQGHTVFVISWVNPDEKLAGKSFEDYMFEGPLAALEAIERALGEREVNLIGYCLGGTLLGAMLAWMTQKEAAGEPPRHRVASATFFVALLDFAIPGELGVFIDEAQLDNLERRMAERGYLAGSEMATTFNLLRANDLVWSFVINNYLLGKEPFPFDLLYWNSDSTRMPARMHGFYLRNMYLKNALKDPGGVTLAGVPLDLRTIRVPAYFVSTAEDHIAPWHSTYRGARLLSGPVRFVLGGSGHIAGIVNPPAATKYCYWENAGLPETPEQWQAGASRREGSWWKDWQAWIGVLNGEQGEQHGGERVPARVPGAGGLPAIEDAPGSYVRVRAGNAQEGG